MPFEHDAGGVDPRAYLVSTAPVPGGGATADAVLLGFVDVTALASAEAELREAVRSRDEFVSVATHELKEPLTSMLLSLHLLEALAGGARRWRPGKC